MNRWKNLLAAVCGAVLLAGCSGQEQGLFAFCGEKTAEFAAAFDEAAVESVEYGYTVDTPLQCTVTDEGEIREIFDALSRVRVGGSGSSGPRTARSFSGSSPRMGKAGLWFSRTGGFCWTERSMN